MGRLTYKDGRGRNALLINGQEHHGPIADRLAAYEDAEADGRLIILPVTDDGPLLPYKGRMYRPDHWNVLLTAFSDDDDKKFHLFGIEDALAALEERKERENHGEG